MPWVRFDDAYPINRKVAGLKDGPFRVHTEAICWAARNLTDGIIRAGELGQIRTGAARHIGDLVARDLWHPADSVCESCAQALDEAGCTPPADGWVIHDYLRFQPSRGKVHTDRAAKTERQRRWLDRVRHGVAGSVDASIAPTPHPNPHPPRRKAGAGAPAAVADRSPNGGGDWREERDASPPPTELLDELRKRLANANRHPVKRAAES